MNDDEMFEDLMDRWEEAWAAGNELSLEDLCRDHPHLIEQVKRAVEVLKHFAWLRADDTSRQSIRPGSASEHQAGDIVAGHFRLKEQLGRGAHGAVWRGLRIADERVVAIKIPRSELAASGRIEPLLVEAKRASLFDHPHIVPVYLAGWFDGSFCIVSKYIDGESLADRLRLDRLPVADAIQIGRQLAAALAYAHCRGVIHRDIKPGNILLDTEGRAYVSDFGIALVFGECGLPRTGHTGTAPYMAPEQYDQEVVLDGRCDIHALGVVLYEMLTGQTPRIVLGESAAAEGPGLLVPIPPSRLNPDVTSGIDEAVLRCFSAKPDNRYDTADEVFMALGGGHTPLRPSVLGTFQKWLWSKRMLRLRERHAKGAILSSDLEEIVELLHPENPFDRFEVSEVLAEHGSAAVQPILESLQRAGPNDYRFQQALIFTLGRIGRPARVAIPILKELEGSLVFKDSVQRALRSIRRVKWPATRFGAKWGGLALVLALLIACIGMVTGEEGVTFDLALIATTFGTVGFGLTTVRAEWLRLTCYIAVTIVLVATISAVGPIVLGLESVMESLNRALSIPTK